MTEGGLMVAQALLVLGAIGLAGFAFQLARIGLRALVLKLAEWME